MCPFGPKRGGASSKDGVDSSNGAVAERQKVGVLPNLDFGGGRQQEQNLF
jgi:hypothetical protein